LPTSIGTLKNLFAKIDPPIQKEPQIRYLLLAARLQSILNCLTIVAKTIRVT
jgi:hypothetical protein